MKNPKRIKKMLHLIEKIWIKNPNLRLGQLIGNCFAYDEDYYFIEDSDLENKLRYTYKEDNE